MHSNKTTVEAVLLYNRVLYRDIPVWEVVRRNGEILYFNREKGVGKGISEFDLGRETISVHKMARLKNPVVNKLENVSQLLNMVYNDNEY